MKLAFYYHIPIYKKGNNLYCPGYLGVFLDSLASQVNELVLFMHESEDNQKSHYKLKNTNITFVSLGKKLSAWRRALFNKTILKVYISQIKHCDMLLVRAPSPLAPYFKKHLEKIKLAYLLVGDYEELSKSIKINSFRNLMIKFFMLTNNYLLERQLKKNLVVVNSKDLYEKYKNTCEKISFLNTTTLSDSDFYFRENTCLSNKINILFTGRISFNKELLELINAFSKITEKVSNIHLNLVGWEENIKKPVERELISLAKKLNVYEKLTFHGFKNIGNELNQMYRMADIYILPSYSEGFPRTIWEAMANSVPVICTCVGSIPSELKNGHDALIINPKSEIEIQHAILKLIDDSLLRKSLIRNASVKVSSNTLEIKTEQLIKILKDR